VLHAQQPHLALLEQALALLISTVLELGPLVLSSVNQLLLEFGLERLISPEKEKRAQRQLLVRLEWALVSLL